MIVRSPEDLRTLVTLSRLRGLRRASLILDIAAIDAAERERLQTRLNRLLHDCGCSAGAWFSLSGAIVMSVVATRAHFGILQTIAAAFAALIVFGIAGKLAGLAFAAFRFRRLCLSIVARAGGAA